MVSDIRTATWRDYQRRFDDVCDIEIITDNSSHNSSYSITIQWFPSE